MNEKSEDKMLYVGKVEGLFVKDSKERLMKTWLAYDYEYNRAFLISKSERTKVFWVTTRYMDIELLAEIQHKIFNLTLDQLHEKFNYPVLLDGNALKQKVYEIDSSHERAKLEFEISTKNKE